ncbi:MAG TPA: hypothetical protein VKI20_09460, partial [Acidimicrobiales bacterium]|nr:hypothetical protein [Acidimicrobiales bacterium]
MAGLVGAFQAPGWAAGGIITTAAGNGTAAYSGDGGPATSAALNFPLGVAVDGSGNMFVADGANNRVRKVSPAGTITTFVGTGAAAYSGDGGPATAATLDFPTDVAVDGSGNLFIADFNNSVVRKVSPAGVITTVAGSGTPGYSGDGGPATLARLTSPVGVALDSGGNLYVAD